MPPEDQRIGLTFGRSRDPAAGVTALALALFAFFAGWHFDLLSGTGIFLRLSGVVLALSGAAILILRIEVPNPRDYYGGLALVGLALLAFWAGSDLAGTQGFSFGPGTAPRLFAGVLTVVGGTVAALGLLTHGAAMEAYAVRGPVLVTASILSFAIIIRPAGLVIASFLTFMIAALASKETRLGESLIVAVLLTGFCVLLFVYLLHLPFQLWPIFLLR